METILIAGGSGLIGTALTQSLKMKYRIRILSRSAGNNEGYETYVWDLKNQIMDAAALEGTDHIINLSGAGIADKRWSKKRKEVLISSRVDGNELLAKYLKASKGSLKTFTCASAVGFYGNRGSQKVDEISSAGDGFLSECALAWEASARKAGAFADKMSIVRLGIVLSRDGGALPKLTATRKIGMLNYFGDGSDYYSWIHIDDVVRVFTESITHPGFNGIVNAVAPNPIRQKEFIKKVGRGLGGRFLYLPVPKWAIRLAYGEMSAVVLDSTRVIPQKLLDLDFTWKHTEPDQAVGDLFRLD